MIINKLVKRGVLSRNVEKEETGLSFRLPQGIRIYKDKGIASSENSSMIIFENGVVCEAPNDSIRWEE